MAKKSVTQPAEPYKDPEDGSEQDYKANRAYDTMSEAAGHMADPGMMDRVKKVAGRKHKAINGLNQMLGAQESKENAKPVKTISDLREIAATKASTKRKALMGTGGTGMGA